MNFAALRAYAATRFRDPNNVVVSDADWKFYINDAYNDMVTQCPWFPFNNATANLTIAGNAAAPADPDSITRSSALPTDAWQVTAVWDKTNQFPLVPLEGRGANLYNEYPQQIEIGQAMHYRIFGNQLQVYPAPQSTTIYRVEYILRPPDMAADGDLPLFPEQYHTTIVAGALALAYTDDGNPQMAQQYNADFENEVKQFKADMAQPQQDRYWEIVDTFL
jgi:hypothetical protein